MTCSMWPSTIFLAFELLLSLLALFVVFYEKSEHCLTIHQDSALHSCQNSSQLFNSMRIQGVHDLFIAQDGDQKMREILKNRLDEIKSFSCRSLEIDWSTAPISFLVYFLTVNGVYCVVLYFRRRMVKVDSAFHRWEPVVLAILTATSLAVIIYHQNEDQKQLTSELLGADGINLEFPTNWLKANALAIVMFLWKTVQVIFHITVGEKKISVDHSVFKVFDFSKNYGSVPTSEETHQTA